MHHDDLKVGLYYRETQDNSILKLRDKWVSNLGGLWEMEFKCIVGQYPFYASGRPEFDTLEEIHILEAQIWIPKNGGEFVQIEMFAGGVVEYIGCDSNISDSSYIDDFLKRYELMSWIDEAEPVTGVNCAKCGEFFEYVSQVNGFKCWGCRNGW